MLDPWRKPREVQILPHDGMKVGQLLYGFDTYRSGATFVLAHPLDVIALKHPRDPLARLDEAMAWIVQDAHRKLDRLVQ